MAKCREMKIAGATVFRGLEGYGETGEMHRAHVVGHDQPILISIVDTAENIARLIPVIEQMMTPASWRNPKSTSFECRRSWRRRVVQARNHEHGRNTLE